ncbi:MAG: ABC transporter permease [Clostridiales bacterium]|nr:ABC transporter permease [Clostridiales bacterium]
MKIFDILHLAALNLYRRLGRSLLTVIGVVIGTTSIIIMIAIGLTNLAQFDEMLQGAEITKIQVSGNSTDQGMGGGRGARLDDAAVSAFLDIEDVDRVVPVKYLQAHAEAEKYHADYLNILAVPAKDLPSMAELKKGIYPREESLMPQIIMGMGAAKQFIETERDYLNRDYRGPAFDWLKTPIHLYLGGRDLKDDKDMPGSRQYRADIVGIIRDRNEEYPNYDIYMSLERVKDIQRENHKLVRELNGDINSYDIAYVYADKMENVKTILKRLNDYGYEAYSDTEWIDEMQKQQRSQQGQLAALGFISLIVSAIGIANTMMTGVLERRREIGVMKVVGVAIKKIRDIFLVEAAMIGLLGGLAGVLLSHIFAYSLSTGSEETIFLGMYFRAGIKMLIPLWLDMAAMGIAIVVGIIAGIFPTTKATKMSPLEAIRS